jgi:hypothetical protein
MILVPSSSNLLQMLEELQIGGTSHAVGVHLLRELHALVHSARFEIGTSPPASSGALGRQERLR